MQINIAPFGCRTSTLVLREPLSSRECMNYPLPLRALCEPSFNILESVSTLTFMYIRLMFSFSLDFHFAKCIHRPLADPLNQPVSRASVQIKITSHRAASNMIIMSADDLVNSNLHQFVRAVNPKGREAGSHSISARGTRGLWRVLEQDGNSHGEGMGREGWLVVLRPPNTGSGFLTAGHLLPGKVDGPFAALGDSLNYSCIGTDWLAD